jgi:hypothetical protein
MARNSNFHDEHQGAVPEAERRPILLRTYAEPIAKEPRSGKSKIPEWVLVFDTETTTDESQRLRFGAFQLLRNGKLRETGLFCDHVTPAELETLKVEAAKHGCSIRSVSEFVHQVFLPAAFKAGALVVGFNLPFDLSRLAISHNEARVSRSPRSPEEIAAGAPLKPADRFMAGGFTFRLSPFDDQPFLRVKHRNSRSSFFRFAKPAHQETARSQRRRGDKVTFQSGSFLDVKTLAASLTSTSYSLRSLAKYLGVMDKGDFTDFERAIDPEFIDYALNDVETTRQCFEELIRRYGRHGLRLTSPQSIQSEASLGKAYLQEMGVRPWRQVQKDFDPETIGAIMSSYFGGRAEVHIRRSIVPTLYCDFASMYPTVCTLMGLWRFVIAKGIDEADATVETQNFLDSVRLADLQEPENWKKLTTLVQVLPDADIFPVRARYAPKLKGERKSDDMPTIGVNYLSADRPLWFTLADCVASKLLTGKAPKVIRAIRFTPKPPQDGLKPIKIYGNPEFTVEPWKDDFYKRVIDLRRRVKGELKKAEEIDPESQETKNLDIDQFALKILANATSYGIFVELNAQETDETDGRFPIFTSQGKRIVEAEKREQPGRFYHPLLGTFITGAARLMLALTERQAFDHGLNWAFCDTDSMAFANTGELPFEQFVSRVQNICDWFKPLNPYELDPKEGQVSILEMEKQNKRNKTFEPLYCFAISAKRYALFNLDAEGKPVLRKASAHGLGHFVAPYGSEEEARKNRDSGVRPWEEDIWKQIIAAALRGKPGIVDYKFRRELNEPARSQYSATKPPVLNWFERFNNGLLYAEQVKPFNFLLSFFARRQEDVLATDPTQPWDPKFEEIRPVAPYEKNLSKALPRVFDRNSDELKPILAKWLRTVADVLRDYHRQPEYKFLGGGWNEAGILRRRHVFAEFIEDIGKESDGWEEDDARTEDQDTILIYPSSSTDRERMIELIKSVGKRELKCEAKIAMRTIDAVHKRSAGVADKVIMRLAGAAGRIKSRRAAADEQIAAAVAWLKSEAEILGLNALAGSIGADTANLAKVISEKKSSVEGFACSDFSHLAAAAEIEVHT